MRTNNLSPSMMTRPVPRWVPELAQTTESPIHQDAGFFVSAPLQLQHATARDQAREQMGWNLIPENGTDMPSR